MNTKNDRRGFRDRLLVVAVRLMLGKLGDGKLGEIVAMIRRA